LVAVVALTLMLSAAPALAAGPWRGRVVDGETKAPLDGVFVLAVWSRRAEHMQIGYGQTGFYTLAEAVTDADGRFTIPARLLLNPPLAFPIKGPELAFVRAGYGGWRLVGAETALTGSGAVIELRPLPTRAARVAYLQARTPRADRESPGWRDADRPANPDAVPYARLARYAAAVNAARAAVGLGPVGFGFPGLWPLDEPRDPGQPPWPPSGVEVTLGPSRLAGPPPVGPAAIAVDGQGRVFVTEPARHRVHVFGPTGKRLGGWGAEGDGPGQFRRPLGVATDRAGLLYVTDAGNRRVQKFTAAGAWVATWEAPGSGDFQVPGAVAVDAAGDVYVGDAATGRVSRFGPDGTLRLTWAVGGPSPNPLASGPLLPKPLSLSPFGARPFVSLDALAIDADGRVLVVDRVANVVRRFTTDGTPVGTWPARDLGDGRGWLTGIAVAAPDRLYVIDRSAQRLLVLDGQGHVLETWGEPGGAVGQLFNPHGVAVGPTGTVYVTDLGNARIQTFTPTGALGIQWGGFLDETAFRHPHGVAIDASGALYVADTDHHRVVKLSPTLEPITAWGGFGREEGQFQFPRGVALGADGTVYVADWGNYRVQRFTPDGRFLDMWGELRSNELGGAFDPMDLALTRAGEVVVFANHRIWRFTPSGHPLGRWGAPFQFAARSGVAIDGQGHVIGITGDSRLDRPPVRQFDGSGTPIAAWGAHGRGVGQLFDPIGLAIDRAGRIYIADADVLNPRVMVFDARGGFLHQWDRESGSAPGLRFPHGLAVDRQGFVYVTDLQAPRLHKLGPWPTQ
jgi:DNA-binding beta-propeller fold protein YncE